MTKELKELTAKIQKIVPEIMELKFGCKLNIYGTIRVIVGEWEDDDNLLTVSENDGGPQQTPKTAFAVDPVHFKILGRDITNDDILIALAKNQIDYKFEFELFKGVLDIQDHTREIVIELELGKPLQDQHQETIEELNNLI